MARPLLSARPPADPAEERALRKLAAARHAPASWIQRAKIVTGSWDGATVTELAERLGCHPKTVSKWLHRFNAAGVDGLADLPRPGVPRRISERDRGQIIQLARAEPPATASRTSGSSPCAATIGSTRSSASPASRAPTRRVGWRARVAGSAAATWSPSGGRHPRRAQRAPCGCGRRR